MAVNRNLLYTIFEYQELLTGQKNAKVFNIRKACELAGCSKEAYYRIFQEYIGSGRHPAIVSTQSHEDIVNSAMAHPQYGKHILYRESLQGKYPLSTIQNVLNSYGIARLSDRLAASCIFSSKKLSSEVINKYLRDQKLNIIPTRKVQDLHVRRFMKSLVHAGGPLATSSFPSREGIRRIPILYPGCLFYFFIRKPEKFQEKIVELSLIDHMTGFAFCRMFEQNVGLNYNSGLRTFIREFLNMPGFKPSVHLCNGMIIVDFPGCIPNLKPLTDGRKKHLKINWSALLELISVLGNEQKFVLTDSLRHPFLLSLDRDFYPVFSDDLSNFPSMQRQLPGFISRYNQLPTGLKFSIGYSPIQMISSAYHLIPNV